MASNEFELEIPGVSGRVTITRPTAFGGSEVRVDGHPAPKGSKRGTYELPTVAGGTKVARLRPSLMAIVPAVEVDDVKYEVGPKISIGLFILCCLPFGLAGFGGALGGACGGAAFGINLGIARSTLPLVSQVLAMLAVTIATGVVFFFVAGALGLAING